MGKATPARGRSPKLNAGGFLMAGDATRHKRPNVIWFFDDQHRAQAMGCAGDSNVSTPNMDALVDRGVWFRRALSGCPWCSPFRGSMLTGLYPHQCGAIRTPHRLDPSIPTIARIMEGAGYETAYFGKWHLAWDKSVPVPEVDGRPRHDAIPVPRERRGGFRTWIGYNNGNSMFDLFLQGHTADGEEVPLYRSHGFEPDCLTDLLIDFVRNRGGPGAAEGRPFFAALSAEPPHPPYVAPEEWMARYKPEEIVLRRNVPNVRRIREATRMGLAGYYAMIENLDHNLGRLMAALDEAGLAESTCVMVFSDHGDMLGSHGYRDKSQPWEESIRIPFIVGGAVEATARGRRVDGVLNTVDIAPTTLGLCGVEVPEALPGFDYSGYVTGPTEGPLPGEPDSALCQHLVVKKHADGMNCTWRALVTRDGWKIICTENTPLAVFDLNEDPYEQHNLLFKERYGEQRRELLERLRRWIAETGDTYPLPG